MCFMCGIEYGKLILTSKRGQTVFICSICQAKIKKSEGVGEDE